MKRIPAASIVITCGLGLAGTALAQTVVAPAPDADANATFLKRSESRFGGFAGSNSNADSLANGLRSGTPITLKGSGETTTFTPPTRPMGQGNVTRALDLAQRQLAAGGITDPTPNEIRIALMGGSISGPDGTTRYPGVLQLRSEGMGWGQIAHTIGVHPGMGKASTVPAPVSAPGAKSGIVTAIGTQPAGMAGNGRSPGNSGNVKVSAAGANANAAAGISTAAGAGGGVGAAARGQGNAFGHVK